MSPEFKQNLPVEETGAQVIVDVDLLIENIYINPAIVFDTDKLTEAIRNQSLSSKIMNSRIKERIKK